MVWEDRARFAMHGSLGITSVQSELVGMTRIRLLELLRVSFLLDGGGFGLGRFLMVGYAGERWFVTSH